MTNAIVASQLVGTRCADCGDVRFPPRTTCAVCASPTQIVAITGGHVISGVQVGDGVMLRIRSELGPVLVVPADGPAQSYPSGSAVQVSVVDGIAKVPPLDGGA